MSSISFCITAEQLRAALAEIEVAEANGFKHCLAVFDMQTVGSNLDQCRAAFSDLIEKAHPTDPKLNWGRFQSVTKRHHFVRGKLRPITRKSAQ